MDEHKKYPNKLGIIGWLGGGRWGIERYLYTLHRITGLGILLYFCLHIFVTSSRLFGMNAWEKWMGFFKSPIFKMGEFLVFVGFAFHALNGIRLILIEFGFAVGKAEEPVYPYKSSLNTQRPLMVIVMVVAAVLIVAGGYQFLGFVH
ncbi:MAG: succinate dehydrogenase, cytochrome b556 subunit [candidate division Zixibacteria bacterium 4484_95]|nr:MAG: succinate dehydrogenase, cytochrome b556 subunit [candidate division Zixibacteria bacterium 4484_95]RKX19348.1 MAG: succinate dehydrogenase, cytochrome b556 subunit [candidate division Zixibacteria bacterium]